MAKIYIYNMKIWQFDKNELTLHGFDCKLIMFLLYI